MGKNNRHYGISMERFEMEQELSKSNSSYLKAAEAAQEALVSLNGFVFDNDLNSEQRETIKDIMVKLQEGVFGGTTTRADADTFTYNRGLDYNDFELKHTIQKAEDDERKRLEDTDAITPWTNILEGTYKNDNNNYVSVPISNDRSFTDYVEDEWGRQERQRQHLESESIIKILRSTQGKEA